MKACQIREGGLYIARVSGKLSLVRVDRIRDSVRVRSNNYTGKAELVSCDVYDVTNLATRRRTVFRSARRFLREVSSSE